MCTQGASQQHTRCFKVVGALRLISTRAEGGLLPPDVATAMLPTHAPWDQGALRSESMIHTIRITAIPMVYPVCMLSTTRASWLSV